MRRMTGILFGLLLGGGFVFLAFTYHLVRADEGHLFVPKHQASLADIYVDVREWNADRWRQHPLLIKSVTEYGRSDLIVESTSRHIIRDILEGFRGMHTASPEDESAEQE